MQIRDLKTVKMPFILLILFFEAKKNVEEWEFVVCRGVEKQNELLKVSRRKNTDPVFFSRFCL